MFYIFVSGLIAGVSFIMLGKYAAYLAVIEAVSRVTVVLLAIVAAVLLFRKLKLKSRRFRPEALTHRSS